MCYRNRDCHFYSLEYSITLNIDELGRISGYLMPSLEENSIKFPLTGCSLEGDGFVRFSFYVDWSFPDDREWGFTCFSGQFVNSDIIILDWMIVENNGAEDHQIVGYNFLYSSKCFNERIKLPRQLNPFPINLALAKFCE